MTSPEIEDKTKKTTTHIKQIVNGGISSAVARFTCQPLDVLKIRFQLQKEPIGDKSASHSKYTSMRQAIRVIFQEEGVRGFWKGHLAAQYMGSSQGLLTFWIFEQNNDLLSRTSLSGTTHTKNFLSGLISGTFGVLVFCPLETVKTRLIAIDSKQSKLSIRQAFAGIIRTDGYKGLYKGCMTGVLQVGPLLGSKFMFFHLFCELMNKSHKHDDQQTTPAWMLLIAGGASGILSNSIMYPLDVVKRRIQIGGFAEQRQHLGSDSSCWKLVQCFQAILKQEGIRGLFKGMWPCLVKSCVSTAVTFTVYGKLQSLAS